MLVSGTSDMAYPQCFIKKLAYPHLMYMKSGYSVSLLYLESDNHFIFNIWSALCGLLYFPLLIQVLKLPEILCRLMWNLKCNLLKPP